MSTCVLVATVLTAAIVIAALWNTPCTSSEPYLVAPYLDLDQIGLRGNYYALSSCA